jgi:hypothetical protein
MKGSWLVSAVICGNRPSIIASQLHQLDRAARSKWALTYLGRSSPSKPLASEGNQRQRVGDSDLVTDQYHVFERSESQGLIVVFFSLIVKSLPEET